MPRNATILKLFDVAFWIALIGAMLSGAGFGLTLQDKGSRLTPPLFIALVVFAALVVVVRLLEDVVRRRILARAFAAWQANPALGPTISGEVLAELADVDPGMAWQARDWLLQKGTREGVLPEVKPPIAAPLSVEANRWEFRFPRNP